MNDLDFFDVVRILPSSEAVSMGVDDKVGIIVGVSGESDSRHYAVLTGDETYMLSANSLERTGDRVDRNAVYEGQSIRIAPERSVDGEEEPPTVRD